MKIYLASPFGFAEATRAFYEGTMLPALRDLGYDVLDPWALTPPATIDIIRQMPFGPARRDAFAALNPKIGHTNARAIDACDAVLAVLDGADVDSGTASEIGYAAGKGKPIVGYRGDFRICSDNEGSIVNLQVEYFIVSGGGEIVTEFSAVGPALARVREMIDGKTQH